MCVCVCVREREGLLWCSFSFIIFALKEYWIVCRGVVVALNKLQSDVVLLKAGIWYPKQKNIFYSHPFPTFNLVLLQNSSFAFCCLVPFIRLLCHSFLFGRLFLFLLFLEMGTFKLSHSFLSPHFGTPHSPLPLGTSYENIPFLSTQEGFCVIFWYSFVPFFFLLGTKIIKY